MEDMFEDETCAKQSNGRARDKSTVEPEEEEESLYLAGIQIQPSSECKHEQTDETLSQSS